MTTSTSSKRDSRPPVLPIPIAEFRRRFIYDPTTGTLTYRVSAGNGKIKAGTVAGMLGCDGYRRVTMGRHGYRTHRIAWALTHGRIPSGAQIDHINGDRTDNRIVNLRLVSGAGNQRNVKMLVTNTSGATGVRWVSSFRKWVSRTNIDGRLKHIGVYTTFNKAVAAVKAARKEHGYHPNHGRKVTSK